MYSPDSQTRVYIYQELKDTERDLLHFKSECVRLNFIFFLIIAFILKCAFLYSLLDKHALWSLKDPDSDPDWTCHFLTE